MSHRTFLTFALSGIALSVSFAAGMLQPQGRGQASPPTPTLGIDHGTLDFYAAATTVG